MLKQENILNAMKDIQNLFTLPSVVLMAEGADVNTKDKDGWTPSHIAAIISSKEVAELLISKGADVNAILMEE